MRNSGILPVLLGLGLAVGLPSGCSTIGYQLGSMLPSEIQTIFVPTIKNNSTQPLLETEVTRQIIQELQRDGSLDIASEENADSVLNVVVTDYRIVPIAYQDGRETATEVYRLYLTASFVATRTDDGAVLADSPWVQGDSTFELLGDLRQAKEDGLPIAARDLARNIVAGIVEYW